METTKFILSYEISKSKEKKKALWQWGVVAGIFGLLIAYAIQKLIALSAKAQLPIWFSLCMLAIGLFGLFTCCLVHIPLGKIPDPTDDEIKALAQKEIDKMDMSEDMTGEIDEERREKLKKIIND